MGSAELKKQFEDLQSELTKMQREAALALAAVKSKSDVKIQLGNWRERQKDLTEELKIVEADLLQLEIPECQSVYKQAKDELKELEKLRETIAIQWRQKVDEVSELERKHRLVDVKCYSLDETVQEMVESISEKRRRLADLIREVVTPVEDMQPTIRSNKE